MRNTKLLRSNSVKLVVLGHTLADGRTHKPILSDESTFSLDDAGTDATDAGCRRLVVTLTKREETRGRNHWPCAVQGEGLVDTSRFGVPVTTLAPDDMEGVARAFGR